MSQTRRHLVLVNIAMLHRTGLTFDVSLAAAQLDSHGPARH
jgi:hypothetical protein